MLWFGCFATASRALSRNHAREETEMKHNWKLPAALLCALLLFGCAQGGAAGASSVPAASAPAPSSAQTAPENGLEPVSSSVLADLERRAAALADLCRPWLAGQQAGDAGALRAALEEAGEPVLVPEHSGVSALSGAPDAFSAFRQAALSGQNARLEAVSVAESGHVYLVSYYLEGSGAFCAQARLEYDETGAAHPGGPGQTDIENWQFTEKGNLIFELALSPLHEDGHSMLRAQPVPQAFQDAAAQYLDTVGYRDNDLFSKNWQAGDMGDVCLNDAFDAMMRLATGQDYSPAASAAPSFVPAEAFEQALCQYLPVTPSQLRAQAGYDAEAGGYPYLPYGVAYWAVLPEMAPEVTSVQEHADGTLTLTVDVACMRRGTDRLFTHELTVQPGGDGTFRFLSNRIVWQDGARMPQYHTRLSGYEATAA